MPSAISVGSNPTFSGVLERRVESFVLDRTDLDLYGVEVTITLVHHLREMVAFGTTNALIRQLHADVDLARNLLTSL